MKANILLMKGRAKIADFGLVTSSLRASLTVGPGAWLYMAPEILDKDYSCKVDIYRYKISRNSSINPSFGVMALEIVLFLDACEDSEKLKKIDNRIGAVKKVRLQYFRKALQIYFQSLDVSDLSVVYLRSTIAAALRKNPDERPSAKDLLSKKEFIFGKCEGILNIFELRALLSCEETRTLNHCALSLGNEESFTVEGSDGVGSATRRKREK